MMRLYGFVLAGKKVLILGFFCADMRFVFGFFSLSQAHKYHQAHTILALLSNQ